MRKLLLLFLSLFTLYLFGQNAIYKMVFVDEFNTSDFEKIIGIMGIRLGFVMGGVILTHK